MQLYLLKCYLPHIEKFRISTQQIRDSAFKVQSRNVLSPIFRSSAAGVNFHPSRAAVFLSPHVPLYSFFPFLFHLLPNACKCIVRVVMCLRVVMGGCQCGVRRKLPSLWFWEHSGGCRSVLHLRPAVWLGLQGAAGGWEGGVPVWWSDAPPPKPSLLSYYPFL